MYVCAFAVVSACWVGVRICVKVRVCRCYSLVVGCWLLLLKKFLRSGFLSLLLRCLLWSCCSVCCLCLSLDLWFRLCVAFFVCSCV